MQPTAVTIRFIVKNEKLVDEDVLLDLLRSLVDDGIITQYFSHPIRKKRAIEFLALTIDETSFDIKIYSGNTTKLIQLLKHEFEIAFTYKILSKGDLPFEGNLDKVSGFILYHGGNSPVRSLNNFYEVPLYLLPPTSEDKSNYFNINTWNRNYEAIYYLWFRGEVAEDFFFTQLTSINSDLSKQGITLCRLISSLTGKDCYYYLYRYPGEEKSTDQYCPSCSELWKLENKLFDMFEFLCPKCLLIS